MRSRYFALIVIVFALALLPVAAQAHGGGVPRVTAADAGGYLVYVWSDPANPRANDTVHITVGVTLPGAGIDAETPVTDAAVTVLFMPPSGGAPLETTATPGASAGSLYYEADIVLPSSGDWLVRVRVRGAQGSGEVTFAQPVGEGAAAGYLYIVLGIVIVGLGIGLFLRQSRRAGARSGQASA